MHAPAAEMNNLKLSAFKLGLWCSRYIVDIFTCILFVNKSLFSNHPWPDG